MAFKFKLTVFALMRFWVSVQFVKLPQSTHIHISIFQPKLALGQLR